MIMIVSLFFLPDTHVPTLHLKMAKPNVWFALLIIFAAFYYFMPLFPPFFWVESLHVAAYLLNIRLTRLLNNLTPMHILYNRVPLYDHSFATRIYQLLLLTKWVLALRRASSLGIPLLIGVIDALISQPRRSLFCDTLFFTNLNSLILLITLLTWMITSS